MNNETTYTSSKTGLLGLFLVSSLLLLIAVGCGGSSDGGGQTIGDARATAEVAATEQAVAEEESSVNAFANVTAYCEENPVRCIESGNLDSDVVVFEFSDYGCSGCKSFNDQIVPGFKAQYVDTDAVKFVKVISAPLYPARWDSRDAAKAVMCANELGEGTAFHEGIFSIQVAGTSPPRNQLVTLAESIGLDGDEFKACVDSNKYTNAVNQTTVLAQENGVNSTPTVMVNGQKPTSTSLSAIGQLIQQVQQ